jgi:hypothetical protein
LAVVAGGGRDQASLFLLGAELRGQIDAASHLEGADGLVVLVFHPDLRADEFIQERIVIEGRLPQIVGDTLTGGEDVLESGCLKRCHLFVLLVPFLSE